MGGVRMRIGWLVTNHFLKSSKFLEIYDWLQASAQNHSMRLEIKTNVELLFEINSETFLAKDVDKPDFVLFWDKDLYLARFLEKQGLKVFNSASSIEICDDKALTHLSLMQHDIKQPKTIIAPKTFCGFGYDDLSFISMVAEELKFPFVIKECHGSFGMQVHLAHDENETKSIISKLDCRPFIFQELVKSSYGKDVRINIVGNRVVSSMMRISTTDDFRSNLTIGGKFEKYTSTEKQNEMALTVCDIIGLSFAGVDILFGENDEPIICEVNSNAHFKTTFECTGINVADHIIQYIDEII